MTTTYHDSQSVGDDGHGRVIDGYEPVRSPLAWYGGKGAMAGHLVTLLPPHVHYVEPFCGGLSVLFAKRPSALETVNDIHDGLVTLYRVLRDEAACTRLLALLERTPYARSEYEAARCAWASETDPVRKAQAFFVAARQCFGGQLAAPGWSYSVADGGSRHVQTWLSAIEGLPAVHKRLRRVQIECSDWRLILERYADPQILVYVDPPYVPAVRSAGRRYEHEMTHQDHAQLVSALLAYPGMVVLSGYQHALYAPLEAAGWERRELVVALAASRQNTGKTRTECVWRNPAALRAWEAQRYPLFGAQER